VWDDLERSAVYPIEVELLERRAGRAAADALRAPFVLGNVDELLALFRGAGVNSVEIRMKTGTARFPSIRAMVEADLRGWLPVMGVELAQDLIEGILLETEDALREFVTPEGQVVFDSPALIITGRPVA